MKLGAKPMCKAMKSPGRNDLEITLEVWKNVSNIETHIRRHAKNLSIFSELIPIGAKGEAALRLLVAISHATTLENIMIVRPAN